MHPQASNPAKLRAELATYTALRTQLLQAVPDIDDDTLKDTLEGLSDLTECLAELIRSALDDEAILDGLASRLAVMKARLDRLKVRAERKRALALKTMLDAELPTLRQSDFSASLRKGPVAVRILSEPAIPAVYWKPQPPKLDRLEILAALKAGAEIEGAELTPPPSQLHVSTK